MQVQLWAGGVAQKGVGLLSSGLHPPVGWLMRSILKALEDNDITSVCKRYFKQCLEGLQVAHLAGKASECQSCMEQHLAILGTFLNKNKIDGCNFLERETWLREVQLGNFLLFFPKGSPWWLFLCCMFLWGCSGLWPLSTKHPGKRCSQGRGGPELTGAVEFVWQELPSPRPCCWCSPGMACGFL